MEIADKTEEPVKIVDLTEGRKPESHEQVSIIRAVGSDVGYRVIGNIPKPPPSRSTMRRWEKQQERMMSMQIYYYVGGAEFMRKHCPACR